MEISDYFQAPASIPSGGRRLFGPQNQIGHYDEKKNPCPLPKLNPSFQPRDIHFTDSDILAHY
jgi:hypothetical protein